MINSNYQTLSILPKKERRLLPYFGFPIQTLYLGFLNESPTQKKVLDIGCGNGFLLRNLIYWRNDAYAIDGSLELVQRLKLSGLPQVEYCMFPENVGDLNKNFDWIYCLDVLEHIEDRKSFIQGLFDLKTDQNHMLLIFPNQNHHGTDGLVDFDEFKCLLDNYEYQLVKLVPPLWFQCTQFLKRNIKKVLGFKEGDLFHENPSFTDISNHPQSWILSRFIELYFIFFEWFPPKTQEVLQINDEGIYMIYFGKNIKR